jgi:hypothetical protein
MKKKEHHGEKTDVTKDGAESYEQKNIPWMLYKRGLRRPRNYGVHEGSRTWITGTYRCRKHAENRHSR